MRVHVAFSGVYIASVRGLVSGCPESRTGGCGLHLSKRMDRNNLKALHMHCLRIFGALEGISTYVLLRGYTILIM